MEAVRGSWLAVIGAIAGSSVATGPATAQPGAQPAAPLLVIGALGILTTGNRAKATAARTAAIFEPVDAAPRAKTAVG